MWRSIALAFAYACASCSSGPGVSAPIGAPSPREADAASLSPATWVYHPSSVPVANAALALEDGRCVVVTGDGERWLVAGEQISTTSPPRPGAACRGDALGAAFGAPESLRRIVRAGSVFRFIGESGTLYEATSPLAAFSRVLTPPTRLGRVATHGEATVGISSAGDPYRLEPDGWVRGDSGGARLFDVEVDDDGRALAIAWPEKVLLSRDGGKTFRALKDAPRSIGALAVRPTAGGAPLTVVGLRGQLSWTPGSDTLTAEAMAKPAARNDEGVAQIRLRTLGPRAQAMAPARAVLTGSRWYEIRAAAELPEEEGSKKAASAKGWALVRGKLGGRYEAAPLGDIPADHEPRMGASGPFVVVGYMEPGQEADGALLRLVLRASSDEGRTFREIARLGSPDIRQVRIAVGPNGDALIAGACPSVATKPAEPGTDKDSRLIPIKPTIGGGKRDDNGACRPRAPVLVKIGGKGRPATISAGVATDLRGVPIAPAFSVDGSTLYFLGRRAKGQDPSIFRSDDAGATWTSRALLRKTAGDDDDDRPHFESDDGEHWEGHAPSPGQRRVDLIAEEPLSVDADGALGVVVETPSGRALLSAGADGEVRAVSQPPDSSALFAAHGRRSLAVTVNGEVVTAWETTDGGATWDPAGVLHARFDGDMAMACSAGGCVVGDAITRTGWEAQPQDARATPPPTQRPRPPSIRTPLVCDLDAKPWTVLEGVEAASPFPTVDQIARGKSSWSLLSVDIARGAVIAHAATSDASEPPRITSRALFEAAPAGKTTAVQASHQGEGYAAARLQEDKKSLDVAWVNYFDGVFGKRSIEPKTALPVPKGGTGTAIRLGLLSVSTGGIFVQPSEGRDMAYLDTRGGTSWGSTPDWAALGIPGRVTPDATRVGGRSVHVGLLEAGPFVGLLSPDAPRGASTTFDATTLAPPRAIGATSIVSWAYLGPSPGFLVVASDITGDGWSTATYRAFGDNGTLGAPVAVPTAIDLPDRPRPCRAEEIKTTPRVESRLTEANTPNVLVRGQRHPIEIPGAGDAASPDGTLRLLTGGTVLHGTPQSPCLAGWEASGFDGRRAGAVIMGDLTRAWVFRLAPVVPSPRGATGGVPVEVHGMACRFDPSQPVSPGVWDEPGIR